MVHFEVLKLDITTTRDRTTWTNTLDLSNPRNSSSLHDNKRKGTTIKVKRRDSE
jgi:hypothetical protein